MNDIPDDVRQKMIGDLIVMAECEPDHKDICVVVHNQPECVERCLESVMAHTRDYTLWVWDNASDEPTRSYLERLTDERKIELRWFHKNWGFINPANNLFVQGGGPYVIFLNSDAEVSKGWDEAMIAHLQVRPKTGIVGYQGGLLDENGMGGKFGSGYDIDYVAGWCFAVRRKDIAPGRLFDSENLTFAYAEDSDLSLRLREQGLVPYALHLELVMHHGNKTVLEVAKDPEVAARMKETFEANHAYLRRRWVDYLAHKRVSLHI
jgi:GT2 family glycosyltransferase